MLLHVGRHVSSLFLKGMAVGMILLPQALSAACAAESAVRVDPITRYFHIRYLVPKDAPEAVSVRCAVTPHGAAQWQNARVTPLLSATGLRMAPYSDWEHWGQGQVTEHRAAGLMRTVIFNPYPTAQKDGRVDADFRITIQKPDGGALAEKTFHLQADNSDVVCLEDWSRVVQPRAVVKDTEQPGKWTFRTGMPADSGASQGNALYGKKGDNPLPQLTYPLNLRGWYAVYVCGVPGAGGLQIRLSGDERTDPAGGGHLGEESLWKWRRMDHQHVVLKQSHNYNGYQPAHIDYVRLVPLTPQMVRTLEAPYAGKRDKVVGAYFEPYSWAFVENIQETLQHKQPIAGFAEAGVTITDAQLGRFGAKNVSETRLADQLLHSTIGDPIDGVIPETENVGQMQQYTNTLDAEVRYAHESGMKLHASFGAGACYTDSPLESDFAKAHHDWIRGEALQFSVPQVRAYALGLVREAIEMGADGISLDYCRYPECVDSAMICTTFMRELRRTVDSAGRARGLKHVPILVRFPAKGVRLWECFDYKTWAHEGLVDYLCPSNIQGRHHGFDIRPYVQAAKGTKTRVLGCLEAIRWGWELPGPYLWRAKQVYDQGADGAYIYQADMRILGSNDDRRTISMLGSSEAVNRYWKEDALQRPQCSKDIYLNHPEAGGDKFYWYERVRPWVEGMPLGEMEIYLDGKLTNRYQGPPYVVGSEEYTADKLITPGEHELRIRVKDSDGWFEKTFTVKGGE